MSCPLHSCPFIIAIMSLIFCSGVLVDIFLSQSSSQHWGFHCCLCTFYSLLISFHISYQSELVEFFAVAVPPLCPPTNYHYSLALCILNNTCLSFHPYSCLPIHCMLCHTSILLARLYRSASPFLLLPFGSCQLSSIVSPFIVLP